MGKVCLLYMLFVELSKYHPLQPAGILGMWRTLKGLTRRMEKKRLSISMIFLTVVSHRLNSFRSIFLSIGQSNWSIAFTEYGVVHALRYYRTFTTWMHASLVVISSIRRIAHIHMQFRVVSY